MTTTHVWTKQTLEFEAANAYDDAYNDVDVWVYLDGPDFHQRVYGFWDGGQRFCVNVLATRPGVWRWVSGSNQDDAGLDAKTGEFEAVVWSEQAKDENPLRRGFVQPTANQHALEYADGTPCYLVGDTWWATATHRFPLYDDDEPRGFGPGMGLKDMVRFRKGQGYNLIAMIAAFPNWANDDHPAKIVMENGTTIRSAWGQDGTDSAESMHNDGGRSFEFPGIVPGYEDIYPDVTRLNPEYFKELDKKVDYLNSQGFHVFMEVARRDCSEPWHKYYPWPSSYARYIQYVFARYQANACILSPIHYDHGGNSIPSRTYNPPANAVVDKGIPAFGSLLSCNTSGSSLINFGNADEARWLSLHQIGNRRHHNSHWLLTQIYNESEPKRPALNGEPYYPGFPIGIEVKPETEEADLYTRSGMYGSFLSGGFAGHIYGAAGIWPGRIEDAAEYTIWDGLQFTSGAQITHFKDFVWSQGARFQELIPNADWVYPNKNYDVGGNRGWAYCARTPDKAMYMLYFEADCPQGTVRGVTPDRDYAAKWFNPRNGEWTDAGVLRSTPLCEVELPAQPDALDWALVLKRQ